MFEDIKNTFDFFIREKTRFSRKNFIEKDENLIERNKLENLYIKDVLEQNLPIYETKDLKVLDIGSKNWFYARGEYNYFKKFCTNLQLDGIEIDAYRLYCNFYSRYEVAKYYTKGLLNVNYIAGNLLEIKGKYDYITWFLPFVIQEPHLYWGLPKKFFYPEKLLSHAYSLLSPKGKMLIINQGEIERDAQKLLIEKISLPYSYLGEIKSKHFEYKYNRYGFLVNKL